MGGSDRRAKFELKCAKCKVPFQVFAWLDGGIRQVACPNNCNGWTTIETSVAEKSGSTHGRAANIPEYPAADVEKVT